MLLNGLYTGLNIFAFNAYFHIFDVIKYTYYYYYVSFICSIYTYTYIYSKMTIHKLEIVCLKNHSFINEQI